MFGWGHWDAINSNERLQKHSTGSIRLLAAAIIGQLARLCELVKTEDVNKKLFLSAVKSAQQGKEAVTRLAETFTICKVLLEESEEDAWLLPHRYPLLVRDNAWVLKMMRVCSRYLKHFSFLLQLSRSVVNFKIQLGQPVAFPKLRRAVLPVAWWGMEEDRDVLLGVLRHGWGNWKAICEDAELCFHQQGVAYAGHAMEEEEGFGEEADGEPMEIEPSPKDSQEKSPSVLADKSPSVLAEKSPSVPVDKSPSVPMDKSPSVPADKSPKDSQDKSPSVPQEKLFPSPSILMKRVRRLVDAMEVAVAKGLHLQTLDYSQPAPAASPKRPKKTAATFMGHWIVKESKALRNAILRWGLPVPPLPADSGPSLLLSAGAGVTPAMVEEEKRFAFVADVVDSLLSEVVARLGERPSLSLPAAPSSRLVASPFPYHRCPGCARRERSAYCPFCDMYVGYRVLKVESQLLYKSYEEVQQLARYLETHARVISDMSKEAKSAADPALKPEKASKTQENDVILPSTIYAQRLLGRVQLFYDLEQLVWRKDPAVLRAFLKRWQTSGMHHQDNVPRGWSPPVHDAALFRGVYRWGVVDWETVWRDPELPFYIADADEHKRKPKRRKKDEDGAEPPAELPPELPATSAGVSGVAASSASALSAAAASALSAASASAAPAEKTGSPYSLEDAQRLKSARVAREELVPGLSSLYVLKRINAMLRFFKQNQSFVVLSAINQLPSEAGVLVASQSRRVAVTFAGRRRLLPLRVQLVQEVFWKRNQYLAASARAPAAPPVDFVPYALQPPWLAALRPAAGALVYLPGAAAAAAAGGAFPPIAELLARPVAFPAFPAPRAAAREAEPLFAKSREFLRSVPLPLQAHGATVVSLGRVVTQWPTYHNKNYIWPVGFKWVCAAPLTRRSLKLFASFKDPARRVLYTSEILDGGPEVCDSAGRSLAGTHFPRHRRRRARSAHRHAERHRQLAAGPGARAAGAARAARRLCDQRTGLLRTGGAGSGALHRGAGGRRALHGVRAAATR